MANVYALDLDYSCSVEASERPFSFTDKLLLTAGPCTVSPRVLQALAQPVEYASNPFFQNVRSYNCLTLVFFVCLNILFLYNTK